METIKLSADVRQTLGKKVRFLRRQGLIPANLYGPTTESIPLQIDFRHLQQALLRGGRNAVLTVSVNGERGSRTAVLRGIQRDPRTDELLHVDLYQVDVTQAITAEIPIVIVGESSLVKVRAAVLTQSLGAIEVEGLPTELPRTVEVDVTDLMEIDQEIRVRDLGALGNVTVLTDPDQLVVKLSRSRVEVELEEEAAAAAAVAEEEAPEEAEAEAEEAEAGAAEAEGESAQEKKE
ncbi:MAG: 50S ribosomal protein L25 [Dehalococcoidia bacterium]